MRTDSDYLSTISIDVRTVAVDMRNNPFKPLVPQNKQTFSKYNRETDTLITFNTQVESQNQRQIRGVTL